MSADPQPPSPQAAAEALARGSALSFEDIAARIGVPCAIVRRWNRRHGWRPPAPRTPAAARWSRWAPARREAVARLFAEPALDPGDLAEAFGVRREGAAAFFRACGLPERAMRPDFGPGAGPALRTALRGHVARQIAALDARLAGDDGALDSARVLRDLGGLKRLLDDLDAPDPHAAPDGDAPGVDLDALRAEIAARYARFAEREAPPPG